MADVKLLKEIIEDIDDRGYLRRRESTQLEFKEKFGLKSLAKYLKSIAAFANTKGGIIIYGVKDSPRIPVGIIVINLMLSNKKKSQLFCLNTSAPK